MRHFSQVATSHIEDKHLKLLNIRMGLETLQWCETKGELRYLNRSKEHGLKCRPGTQTYRLIAALSRGPLSRERLIRQVFQMKGLHDDQVEELNKQLRVLVVNRQNIWDS